MYQKNRPFTVAVFRSRRYFGEPVYEPTEDERRLLDEAGAGIVRIERAGPVDAARRPASARPPARRDTDVGTDHRHERPNEQPKDRCTHEP